METIAVFPGSFAPWTDGHFDTLCTALNFCSKVVIGISRNPLKSQRWSFEELKGFIEANIKDHVDMYENRYAGAAFFTPVQEQSLERLAGGKYSSENLIEIADFTKLTVDDALLHKCTLIIRGMRNSTDYVDEEALASVNQKLASQRAKALPTVLIPQTDSRLKDVSSTTFRNLMSYRQYIQALDFVPWTEFNLIVREYLKPQWLDIFTKGSEEDYRRWAEHHLHNQSYQLADIAYLLNLLELYASQVEDGRIFRIMQWAVMSYQSIPNVDKLSADSEAIMARKYLKLFTEIMDGGYSRHKTFEADLFHDICLGIYGDRRNYVSYARRRYQIMADIDYCKLIKKYSQQGKNIFRTSLFKERYGENLRANLAYELDFLRD